MLLENMSWKMVEEYLEHDDRIVLILGATEEHGPNTWLESFPWINQPKSVQPAFKVQTHVEDAYALSAAESRANYGDGVGGGEYTQPEPVMREFFNLAVAELEDFLDHGWSKTQRVPNA
jgi:hypothetical protein